MCTSSSLHIANNMSCNNGQTTMTIANGCQRTFIAHQPWLICNVYVFLHNNMSYICINNVNDIFNNTITQYILARHVTINNSRICMSSNICNKHTCMWHI